MTPRELADALTESPNRFPRAEGVMVSVSVLRQAATALHVFDDVRKKARSLIDSRTDGPCSVEEWKAMGALLDAIESVDKTATS